MSADAPRFRQPLTRRRRVFAIASALVLTVTFAFPALGSRPADPPGQLIPLQLLAFNDFHGHLESGTPGPIVTGGPLVGGAEYLATHLDLLRAGKKYSLTVAAGDLIGGSAFISGIFKDEPAVESLNAMGLDVSGVGNHEFDRGVEELLRMQHGGCHPEEGCYFPDQPYAGADFPWLAANVTEDATGDNVLPPYWIQRVGSVKVGFIGMTLEGTPALVAQAGILGYSFADEAATANALVPELKRQGVETIVVLLHEGASQASGGGIDTCVGISGPVLEIHNNLDAEIDVLITGHTHQPYNCVLPDPAGQARRVTSAFSFGRVISEINLVIDRRTNDVRREMVTATNHLVTQDVTRNAVQTAVIAKWAPMADELGDVPIGAVSADIRRAVFGPSGPGTPGSEDRGSESNAGNMIADAQLAATQVNDAQIAFMNPGGIRADFLYASSPRGEGDGVVTYREAFTAQPFGNVLTTVPMTGDQIVRVLRQQCQTNRHLHLGVSDGFTYDMARTPGVGCTAIEISNVRLNGDLLDMAETYRVTVPNFLLDGGDNFTVLREIPKSAHVGAGVDLDALIAYFLEESPIAPPGTDRVNELAPLSAP